MALALAGTFSTPIFAKGNGGGSGGYAYATLSATEADSLQLLREEEKLARDVYVTLHQQWGLDVFANISSSEQNHMDAIKNLLDKYNLADPASSRVGEFTSSDLQGAYNVLVARGAQSLVEALRVGGFIEELDIGDLDDAMAATHRSDLLQVYGNLQRGSRNHLRAFAGQLESRGIAYDAQLLPQEEVDAILDAPMERGSGL
jgi:hypothetical protein